MSAPSHAPRDVCDPVLGGGNGVTCTVICFVVSVRRGGSRCKAINASKTGFMAVPTFNDPSPEHVSNIPKRDPWTGNQRSILTAVVKQLHKYHKTSQLPVHMWIVLTTWRVFVIDPLMVPQLDGWHTVRLLRRKCSYVLMGKSGHWVRWDRNANE